MKKTQNTKTDNTITRLFHLVIVLSVFVFLAFFIWPLCYLYLCFGAFSFGHCVICICVLGLFHLVIVLSVFVFLVFFIWPLCYLYLCFWSFSFGHCVICICVFGLFHLAIVLSVFVFLVFWPNEKDPKHKYR
jgi:hypothetical protein